MTTVKICGITTLADALISVEAGAEYLGFNFYPQSPRYIDWRMCARITAVLKADHPAIKLVGVFVNARVADIERTLQMCTLDLAQLHGDEGREAVTQLAPHAYKAFRGVPAHLEAYLRDTPPACLLDASAGAAYGGTGRTADWPVASRLAQQHALFLAGGLNPENVAKAVAQVRPWGVDVASGVEVSPGVKDVGKVRAFVQAVRAADRPDARTPMKRRTDDDTLTG